MIVMYIFIFQGSSYDSDEYTERTYNSVYNEICKLYFTMNLFNAKPRAILLWIDRIFICE